VDGWWYICSVKLGYPEENCLVESSCYPVFIGVTRLQCSPNSVSYLAIFMQFLFPFSYHNNLGSLANWERY